MAETDGSVLCHLEVSTPRGVEITKLSDRRVTVGRSASTDVSLAWDRAVGRLHAALEPMGVDWTIRDLDTRNGTFVGGERLVGEHALRAGDEIMVGHTRLVYRRVGGEELESTLPAQKLAKPDVTRAERKVLIELCRPLLQGRQFRQPASVSQIASTLVVGENAIKFHLGNLYKKFNIHNVDNRRVELANQAIERLVVRREDLDEEQP